MKHSTQKLLQKAMEQARKEGFAVIGFAIRPDEGACVKLDNQAMPEPHFVEMMKVALGTFIYHQDIQEQTKIEIVN